jgi:short-subunit dehydrogenase
MRERGRGCVVNVGSGVSTVIPSSPLLSVYASTKAYVDCLSRSLDGEYRGDGVRVQNQAPNFVATKMSKIRWGAAGGGGGGGGGGRGGAGCASGGRGGKRAVEE